MNPIPSLSAITAASLVAWAIALIWAAAVFVGIAGYGGLFVRIFGVRRPTLVVAVLAGFGPAILLGGILNLFHLIYAPMLIGFIVVGLLLATVLVRFGGGKTPPLAANPTQRARSMTAKLLLLGIALVASIRIASSVHDCVYQIGDDMNYYLAAPKKMIQTHSFAPDPFSERREISSVGGNTFIETLILAAEPLETVQMADWTLGIFLLILLAFALGREFELTENQRYALAFFILITPQLRFNLTFVVLPSALFMGLLYIVAKRDLLDRFPVLQGLIVGSMVGSVTSFKSTYLTHGVLFILCIVALRTWKRGWPAAIRFAVLAGIGCVLVMLPWSIANHATAGTYLFPILGKGFHYSAYGHYGSPSQFNFSILAKKVIPFCIPMLVLFAAEIWCGKRDERTLAISALMLTAFAASILNGVATGGDSVRRYNYPCILPAITLLYIVFAQRKNLFPEARSARLMQALAALVAVVTAVNTGTTKFTNEYIGHWWCLKASLTPYRITTPYYRAEYGALDRTLPTDGTAVATVDKPFLLDFSKHHLLLADFPGAASPPPGWPTWSTGEAFAAYLKGQNVRYLVYSYGDCSPDQYKTNCDELLDKTQTETMAKTSITRLIRNEAVVGYQARHQYAELAKTRKHIYDDGRIYILDLQTPAS